MERALRIIALAPGIPYNAIQVKVQGGRITLTDVVTWNSQRLAAEAVMRKLTGLIGVTNNISLHAADAPNRELLLRDTDLEASAIRVSVDDDDTMTLEGKVHALIDRWLASARHGPCLGFARSA